MLKYNQFKGYNYPLIIIICIMIVMIIVALIFYCPSFELFSNSSNNEIHYYSLSTCPHCIEFDPIWKLFQQKTTNAKKFVVDKDDEGKQNANTYNINSFPTIIIVKNNKNIDEVNDRTCGGLREICKKHGIHCAAVC